MNFFLPSRCLTFSLCFSLIALSLGEKKVESESNCDAQEGRPQARLRLPGPGWQLHPHRPRARREGPAVRDAGPQGEEAGRAVAVDRPHQRRREGARGEFLWAGFSLFLFDFCVDAILLCTEGSGSIRERKGANLVGDNQQSAVV